ncbi:MAG: hypothetical protein R3C03_20565 [Pirellulaceae bacterium]
MPNALPPSTGVVNLFATYKPSGRVSPLAFALWLIGAAVVFGLAFVYQIGLNWITWIYINVLLTAGFGLVCAAIANFIVDSGKVRNPFLALVFAFTIAIAGLVGKFFFQFQHARGQFREMLPAFLVEQGVPRDQINDIAIDEIVDQYTFARHIQDRIDTGWAIGKMGRNGAPVSGIFVYFVWLAEAGIVCYLACGGPYKAAFKPFSEKLGQWASETQVVMTLPITHESMVDEIKAIDSVDGLLRIPIPKSDEAAEFAVYRVNSIPGHEMEDAYLSVDLMHFETNKEGNQEAKFNSLVENAILTSTQRATLAENAELLAEAIKDFREALEDETASESVDDERDDV